MEFLKRFWKAIWVDNGCKECGANSLDAIVAMEHCDTCKSYVERRLGKKVS